MKNSKADCSFRLETVVFYCSLFGFALQPTTKGWHPVCAAQFAFFPRFRVQIFHLYSIKLNNYCWRSWVVFLSFFALVFLHSTSLLATVANGKVVHSNTKKAVPPARLTWCS